MTTIDQRSPAGAQQGPGGRMATVYYDEQGVRRKARIAVPVDQFGRVTGVEFRCPSCDTSRWYPKATADRGAPVCEVDNRRMVQRQIRKPQLLPWKDMYKPVEKQLYAVWVGAAVGVVGAVAHVQDVSPLIPLAVAAPAGVVAARVARGKWVTKAVKQDKLDPADPTAGRRLRSGITRRARHIGYCAGGAVSWTALAATAGMDPSTFGGRVSLTSLLLLWLYPAATWWRYLANQRRRQEEAPVPVAAEATDDTNPDEKEVRRIWRARLDVKSGQVIGQEKDGTPIKAKAPRLPNTDLEDWQSLPGGWAATIVGEVGEYDSDQFAASTRKIAAAFSVRKSMVTVMPHADDENRSMVVVQNSSPISDVVRWAGPDSIDINRGVAPMAMYTDGTLFYYELWREGWGSPHDFLCGTTGAGKSEALSMLLLIDRWAHRVDEDGNKVGLVADLLIDPQQGQSYEPFMDDLAAPVATSLDEAKVMVAGLKAEMLRRNAYLSKKGWRDENGVVHRPEWTDARGRVRYGRKWWNPLIDGPIITLNIDEAHEYLADKEFATLITAGARMYRKCGIRIRVATHTPLLADLGGSTALRDMLTGGGVWVGRTANSLSGPIAFNGRLPADPRSIPEKPGMCFPLSGVSKKPMLARAMWEPDFYDWVRDEQDQPIGYPAPLPDVTVKTFGPDFQAWMTAMRAGEDWVPTVAPKPAPLASSKSVDSILAVLSEARDGLDMDGLDRALRARGLEFSTRTVREALKKLRDLDQVEKLPDGSHRVVDEVAEELDPVEA